MPEVILREGEEIDEALRRFKRAVTRNGTVRRVKQMTLFEGAMTKSERRRAKTEKAIRRSRKLLAKIAAEAYKNPDYADDEKKAGFWHDDTGWAVPGSDNTWNPDLTPIPSFSDSLPTRVSAGSVSHSPFFRFGENKRIADSAEPPLPSTHVCGIGELTTNGQKAICIVRSLKKDGKTPRDKFTFPGGGVEKGETPERAMVREYREETALHVEVVSQLFETTTETMEDGKHTFICFLVKIIGGSPCAGVEIVDLKFLPFENLIRFREEIQGLSNNHGLSFDEYRKKLEMGELPVIDVESKQAQTPVKKTRTSKKKGGPHVPVV